MLSILIEKELKRLIMNGRFHVSIILTVILFAVGMISYAHSYKAELQDYDRYLGKQTEELRGLAESSVSRLAVHPNAIVPAPRSNGFIDEAQERLLPMKFYTSAYDVSGYSIRTDATVPILQQALELDWKRIISVVMSFIAIVLTFDTISGERSMGTLAYTFSHRVSRGVVLASKLISVVSTTVIAIVPGICLSIVIGIIYGVVDMSAVLAVEITMVLGTSALFIACIASFGLLASVMARSPRTSLLWGVTFWLLFVTVIPNSMLFFAYKLFRIESARSVSERIGAADSELVNNAPHGSFGQSYDNPFLPEHELRADIQTRRLNRIRTIRDSHFNRTFEQYEKLRKLSYISPAALFEVMSEAVVGGGYPRFRHVWSGLHGFQTQFLAFFKEKDAQDQNSPHWYNPWEHFSTSNKPVDFEEVPQYHEKVISLHERLVRLLPYGIVMGFYTAAVFALSCVLFLRYDVR